MTMLERFRRETQEAPRPSMPVEIDEADLRPADPEEIRGRYFRIHPRWRLLSPRDQFVPESADLPNLPFSRSEVNGKRVALVYDLVDDETWARLTAPPKVAKPKPLRAVSTARGLATFRRGAEVMIPGSVSRADLPMTADAELYAATAHRGDARLVPGEPAATSPGDMIERLNRKHITLRATIVAGEAHLVAFASGGLMSDTQRNDLHRVRRLLAPVVAGLGIPACEAGQCSEPAAEVAWPGEVLVCTGHSDPDAWS